MLSHQVDLKVVIIGSWFYGPVVVAVVPVSAPVYGLLISKLLIVSVHVLQRNIFVVVNVELIAFYSGRARPLNSNLVSVWAIVLHLVGLRAYIVSLPLVLSPNDGRIVIYEPIVVLNDSNISNYVSINLIFRLVLPSLNRIPDSLMHNSIVFIFADIADYTILPVFVNLFESVLLLGKWHFALNYLVLSFFFVNLLIVMSISPL